MKDQMVKTWLLGLMLSVFLFASDDDNWNANFSYELADMCIHNGIEWVAMDSVPAGIEPGTNTNYWEDSEMNCSRTGNCDSRGFIKKGVAKLKEKIAYLKENPNKTLVIAQYAHHGPFTVDFPAYLARCVQIGNALESARTNSEAKTKALYGSLGGDSDPHNAMKHAFMNTYVAYETRDLFKGKGCRDRMLAFVKDVAYAHELDGKSLGTPGGEMDNTNNVVAQYYLDDAFYTDFWGVDEIGINWHLSAVIDMFHREFFLAEKIYPFNGIIQLEEFKNEHKFVYYNPTLGRSIEMLLE